MTSSFQTSLAGKLKKSYMESKYIHTVIYTHKYMYIHIYEDGYIGL